MITRTILSLCDASGEWPRPYRESGYNVVQVDVLTSPYPDVRLEPFREDVSIHGILAAPPCTVFSYARNRYPPTEDEYLQALSVVDACLRAVIIYRPTWWALENPINKLRTFLGPPQWKFRHYQYGDEADKPTGLWGNFNPPMFTVGRKTKPSTFGTNKPNADPSDGITPAGFAKAFFEANP